MIKAAKMAKLTDLLFKSDQLTFSFEVTPELPLEELENLFVEPIFYSVTWHAKSHKNENLDVAPLRLAKYLRSKDREVMLHLSCDLLKQTFLSDLLTVLQENSIRNLFVILGEGYDPTSSDFQTSEDLIKSIREKTGDYFCIGIAGLPDCNDERLLQLKHKVEAGADFVLTQAFFDHNLFPIFRLRCAAAGINVPVLPGVFPFETYQQLTGFTKMCKIKVSQDILDYVQNKDESTEIPGKEITHKLIKTIADVSKTKHFHLFTLNKLANAASIVKPLL